jgi:hypothetical protein
MYGVARMKHLAAHGLLMRHCHRVIYGFLRLSFPSIKMTERFSMSYQTETESTFAKKT